MKKTYIIMVALIGLVTILSNCKLSERAIAIPAEPYETLSEYAFFKGDLASLEPNERVVPYDLNSPLFSDYAHKARFVWMPEGTSANYRTNEVLDFPDETVLIKNFYYENDETDSSKGRRIMETRLLINRAGSWEAVGYIWNDEQTDANLEVIGDIKEVSWVNTSGETQNINYIIPNRNQCKSCHVSAKNQIPIGPKVRNLNKSYQYVDGEMNQLDKWAELGYLSGYTSSDDDPKVATWDNVATGSVHDRALAYLDINCGHCHNPDGSANTSGLTLLANSKVDMAMGVYKATVSAGAGTGGHTYSIVPGVPEESILVYRMKSLNPGAMMPEIGRSTVHHEGVALVSEWIKNMDIDESELRRTNLQ